MNRFILAPEAFHDLDTIIAYLNSLPRDPANRIGKEIQIMLRTVASDPLQGYRHEEFSGLYGADVRTRGVTDYILYYVAVDQPRLILGIIHGKRDADTIMRQPLS